MAISIRHPFFEPETSFRSSEFLLRPVTERCLRFARNRWFESISLQQTVRLSPAAAFACREPRPSARVCAAGWATGPAETRRVFRFRANRRQYLCRAIFQYRSAADGLRECHADRQQSRACSGRNGAVDLSIRMELRQSRARSADRARQAADGSGQGASPPSNRAAASHCKNRSKPAPDFGRKRQVISAESGR